MAKGSSYEIVEVERLREILGEIAACGISYTSPNRYHEVQIPIALWNEIKQLSELERSDV
jgi:hypothetical protein